ncbi:MAG: ABC transporter permease subunit [Acidobacteriota bacterium]|nr:ABC transporter permease subunit [Acidobacteriota bacterium]
MLRDVMTIIWKEGKELLGQKGRFKGGKTGMLIFLAVFGILMPLQNGPAWISSPLAMLYWAWIPILLASGVVADAFAGERERHTLETLLASRLPDRAILAGKIGAAVLYGWGLTVICVLAGAIALTVVHGHGKILFYPLPIAAGIVGATLLVAVFGSALGVMISLRAATVRQAQQVFSVAFLVLLVPLFALPMLPPSVKAWLAARVGTIDFKMIGIAAAGVLAAGDVLLIFIADRRFRRSRLILD